MDLPLGIFSEDDHKGFSYLTGHKISDYFKFIAKEVHELDDPGESSKYSAHSLKVTAAVLLHQAQKDPEYIKICLRWVSNAFQEYLRNTEDIMQQHVKALLPDSLLIQLGKLSANNLPKEVEYGAEEYPSESLLDEDED